MKEINFSSILFIFFYFTTSNWTWTDFYVAPYQKNIFVGIVLILFLVYEFNKNKNFLLNTNQFLFSISILIALFFSNNQNLSLLVQAFFIFFMSFMVRLNYEWLYKTLNYINIICSMFLFINIIQFIIIYFDQSLLEYCYQVTSTGIELNSKVTIEHWIQYLGVLTNERFIFFDKIMPRSGGFLTEPSAVCNLVLLPRIMFILMRGSIKKYDYIFFIISFFLFRSGFIVIYLGLFAILLIIKNINLLNKKTLIVFLFSFIFLILNLEFVAINLLSYLEFWNIYGLENKTNTVAVRVLGLFDMIENFNYLGNSNAVSYGVGFFFLYLIKFGILWIIPILNLFYQLFVKNEIMLFILLLFAGFFLGKGFSSFAILILIFEYERTFISNKYSQ